MVDNNGYLSVYIPATNLWINVGDNLLNSNVTSTLDQVNTTVNTIVGGVGAVATLASYFANLRWTLAVVSGVIVGSALLLALTLKEDRFDVKPLLYKRVPVSSNSEYFNQIELNITIPYHLII